MLFPQCETKIFHKVDNSAEGQTSRRNYPWRGKNVNILEFQSSKYCIAMNVEELYLNTYPVFQLKCKKYLTTEHKSHLNMFLCKNFQTEPIR
jgi:hypothetical protein